VFLGSLPRVRSFVLDEPGDALLEANRWRPLQRFARR
jgi:hypothetical protein